MNDLDVTKYIDAPVIAGIVGSLVGLRFVPGASWSERAFNFGAGSAIAAFCGPAAIEFLSIRSEGMAGFLSFCLGMFGLSIASAIFAGIKDTKLGEILTGWLKRP